MFLNVVVGLSCFDIECWVDDLDCVGFFIVWSGKDIVVKVDIDCEFWILDLCFGLDVFGFEFGMGMFYDVGILGLEEIFFFGWIMCESGF